MRITKVYHKQVLYQILKDYLPEASKNLKSALVEFLDCVGEKQRRGLTTLAYYGVSYVDQNTLYGEMVLATPSMRVVMAARHYAQKLRKELLLDNPTCDYSAWLLFNALYFDYTFITCYTSSKQDTLLLYIVGMERLLAADRAGLLDRKLSEYLQEYQDAYKSLTN